MEKIIKEDYNMEETKKMLNFSIIAKTFKEHRKSYCTVLPIIGIFAYLLILCVPRYYKSSVSLAPESSEVQSGGLGSALSSFGLNALNKLGNNDAISPELYPDLLASNNFIIQMFPIKVSTKDGKLKTTYYDYLAYHNKSAWWNKCVLFIASIFKPTEIDRTKGTDKITIFSMTKKQQDIADLIKSNIKCTIDQKTGAISIVVTDQDPKVAAIIANETSKQLLNFIIEYRTKKAKNDYKYYASLCSKAQRNYERARQVYASYSDANFDPNLESIKSKLEDLENDMQLKFNIYSSMNTQKQTALAKIQEKTPAFTLIESATIPIKPAGPKRMLGAIAIMCLAAVILTIYYLRKFIC